MKKFKDKCDNCKKFDYLKSQNGKCLCKCCRTKKIEYKQMTIFDFLKNKLEEK